MGPDDLRLRRHGSPGALVPELDLMAPLRSWGLEKAAEGGHLIY